MFPLFKFAVVAVLSALFVVRAAADLQILVPGGPNLWWIAKSENNIAWTCKDSPYQSFTVFVANKDPKILVSPLAIIAIEQNADCSKTVNPNQADLQPATGYTIQLVNPLNSSQIYATSQEFEVKSAGSPYPASSATPTALPTGTSTSDGSTSTTATSKKGAATEVKPSFALGLGLAMAAAILGISTA